MVCKAWMIHLCHQWKMCIRDRPYIADEIEPGEYRMVFFSEIGPLYAPFRFVTPEEYAQLSAAGKIESRITYLTPKS